jgi:hypothetical protein
MWLVCIDLLIKKSESNDSLLVGILDSKNVDENCYVLKEYAQQIHTLVLIRSGLTC